MNSFKVLSSSLMIFLCLHTLLLKALLVEPIEPESSDEEEEFFDAVEPDKEFLEIYQIPNPNESCEFLKKEAFLALLRGNQSRRSFVVSHLVRTEKGYQWVCFSITKEEITRLD